MLLHLDPGKIDAALSREITTPLDINAYRLQQNGPEEALLSIIQEKDRVSYPEERVHDYN